MSEVNTFVRFHGANNALDFSFLCPSDWRLREAAGSLSNEVVIIGPRNQVNTYSLAITIRVTTWVQL